MQYSTIIPAAGKGERLNLGYNKLLYRHNNQSILEKTIQPFLNDNDCSEIIIVCSKIDLDYISSYLKNPKLRYVIGGSVREESVYNGVLVAKEDYILIHDGARPFIDIELIERIKNALKSSVSVIPVVKSKDATLINGKYVKDAKVDLIQTPQAFHKNKFLEAMSRLIEDKSFAKYKDDASIMQDILDIVPTCVEGDYKNIKITTSSDLLSLEVNDSAK